MSYTHYEIDAFTGLVTEVTWAEGEVGFSSLKNYPVDITAKTPEALIGNIADKFQTTKGNVELNACEEDGQVDIQVYENASGEIVDILSEEFGRWVDGKARLWAVTYSGTLRKVETGVKF